MGNVSSFRLHRPGPPVGTAGGHWVAMPPRTSWPLLPRRDPVPQLHPAELPHNGPLVGYAVRSDYATTIVRNFPVRCSDWCCVDALEKSPDADLAAIAAKSLKEAHTTRTAADWWCASVTAPRNPTSAPVAAVDHPFPYTESSDPALPRCRAAGAGVDVAACAPPGMPSSMRPSARLTLQARRSVVTSPKASTAGIPIPPAWRDAGLACVHPVTWKGGRHEHCRGTGLATLEIRPTRRSR